MHQLSYRSGALFSLLVAFLLAFLVLLPAPQANAIPTAGASQNCIVITECVVGMGASESAGTSTTGGTSVGACQGVAEAAVIIDITCSMSGVTNTMSYLGTTGTTLVSAPTNSLDRKQVCWTVTAYFYNPSGTQSRSTSGCTFI